MLPAEIEAAHLAACNNHQDLYIDPVSGLSCFTAYSHLKRGECCGKACRHCPYGHFNAVPRARKNTLNRPVLLRARQPSALDNRVVLLWEGSVFDAAALAPLRAEAKVTLCTEFSIDAQATTGSRLPIAVVFDQARALRDVDLLMLPFSAPRDSLAQAAAVVVANAVLCFRADAAPADGIRSLFPHTRVLAAVEGSTRIGDALKGLRCSIVQWPQGVEVAAAEPVASLRGVEHYVRFQPE